MKLLYLNDVLQTIIEYCIGNNKSATYTVDFVYKFIQNELEWIYDNTIFEEYGYIHIALRFDETTRFSYFRFKVK